MYSARFWSSIIRKKYLHQQLAEPHCQKIQQSQNSRVVFRNYSWVEYKAILTKDIYIYSSPDLKKKTIKGKIAVNIQRLIRIVDHSVITELKNIINHSRYCKGSWLLLALQSHLWYVVENIYSKSKK